MTSQGSPYARFQRALANGLRTGRPALAWAAATELDRVDLQDALVLVLLVVDEPRFARAAARWVGRLCDEISSITIAQVQLVAVALAGLPDRVAAIALASVCAELGLDRAAAAARAAYGER